MTSACVALSTGTDMLLLTVCPPLDMQVGNQHVQLEVTNKYGWKLPKLCGGWIDVWLSGGRQAGDGWMSEKGGGGRVGGDGVNVKGG